jgi:beta-lactamase superfamily II metal-dependent hydrolase
VLFTGDAEVQEEEILNPGGSATLLQLGHHGSDTSSSEAFLARVKPKYAVVSAGKPFAGANVTYCHPRVSIIRRVTKLLGGSGSRTLTSFDGLVSCRKSKPANWTQVPASDRLWSTSRDGDVVLLTHGDGVFTRNK